MSKKILGSLAALALCNLMLHGQETKSEPLPQDQVKVRQSAVPPRPFVRNWKIADLEGFLGAGLEGARSFDQGRTFFSQATCLDCHQFNDEGRLIGPDLSAIATRYGPLDMLAHILEPGREIRDPYLQHEVVLKDGSKVLGRIVKLTSDTVTLGIKITDPKAVLSIDRKQIKSMARSIISPMPSGLINSLNETEILDLLAYLLSKGDREDPMFK